MKKKRNRETHESPDANAKQSRYSYADCLRDEVPVPSSASGNLLYQLLLVAGLVIFEMSVSGAIESGASFFAHAR